MARRRIIRKQPLWDKITSYPSDLILSINETRLSIDWDDYIPQSLPIGIGLCHIFLVLCKLSHHYQKSSERRDNSIFKTDALTYQLVMARAINLDFGSGGSEPTEFNGAAFASRRNNKGGFLWVLNFFLIIIAATSLINFVSAFYAVRSYSLLSLNAKLPKPRGSNVVRENLAHGTPRGLFLSIMSYFEEHSYYESDLEVDDSHPDPYPDQYVEKPIWVLKVWDPSAFSLHFTCALSPVMLFIIWLISPTVALWRVSIIILITNLSAFYLVHKFFLLISDKQILYQETFNEYNRKYVIPKTCVLKKNAVVDATCGPRALPQDVVHDDVVGHLQDENVFITHDIHGNRHKTVRADILARAQDDTIARSPSPNRRHEGFIPESISRGFPGENSRGRYNDSISQYNSIAQSTPYRRPGTLDSYRNDTFSRGYDTFSKNMDSFSRQSSQIHSPMRTPARFPYGTNLSFDQRTQLSPSRSSRQLSPQRSPSPSKRRWH